MNRKGGVGKSMLSDELMFSFERGGEQAALIDLDNQDTLIHPDTSEAAESANVTIVDTPGALNEDVEEWLRSADVIVIPTNPSPRDITPLVTAIDMAREYAPDVPRIIVVNRFNRHRASTQFLNSLKKMKQAGETITTIAQSELFQTAFLEERSIVDVNRISSAAVTTLQTINVIRETAGLTHDPADVDQIRKILHEREEREKARRAARRGESHE